MNDTSLTMSDYVTDLRVRLTELANDTKLRLKRSVEDLYYVGLNLIEAKKLLGHGKFISWLKTELNIDRKTAERFINVANMFQGKCDIMSHLKIAELDIAPTILYEIAAPSTPTEVREEVLSRALKGEKITVSDAKKIACQHKVKRSHSSINDRSATLTVAASCKSGSSGSEFPNLESRVKISSGSAIRPGESGEMRDGPNPDLKFVTFPDGAEELFRVTDLSPIQELGISSQPILFTEAELNDRVAQAIEQALIGRKVEIEEAALDAVREQLEAARSHSVELREKNTQLQLEVGRLQDLRQLESENERLTQEIEELKNALQRNATEDWGKPVFNAEAAKVINKEVATLLEKFPPETNLRCLATTPPSPESLPEILELVGQVLQHLTQIGLTESRTALTNAKTWEDFDPIGQKWISIKANIWTGFTQAERIRLKQLKEARLLSPPTPPTPHSPTEKCDPAVLSVGTVVCHADPYTVASQFHGIVEQVFPESGEAIVRWKERAGKPTECERCSMSELKVLQEQEVA